MKINKEGNTLYFEGKHYIIGLYEEWSQFLQPKGYNWISFEWFYIYTEYERWLGDIEIIIAILGLGITIRIHLNTPLGQENYKMLEDEVKEFKPTAYCSCSLEDKDEKSNKCDNCNKKIDFNGEE